MSKLSPSQRRIWEGGRAEGWAQGRAEGWQAGYDMTVEHSTHLEALAWATNMAGAGDALEVGSGHFSTPLLHAWTYATERWLCTIETEPDWASIMSDRWDGPNHKVTKLERGEIDIPMIPLALAFVDGINEDRAAWIDGLRAHHGCLVVVHDTEPGRADMPGVADAIARYPRTRVFDRTTPHTTVMWA